MGGLSGTPWYSVELTLPVQNKCSNTNTVRGVNKQADAEQRQTEILGLEVFCIFCEKAKLVPFILKWNGKFN